MMSYWWPHIVDAPPVGVASHHLLHRWTLQNSSIHCLPTEYIFFPLGIYDDLFHSSCTSYKSLSFLFLLPFLEAPKQGLCRKFEGSSCSGLNRRKSSCWENLNHGGLRTCLCFSPSFLYYFTFFFSLFSPFLLYVFLFYFISAFALAQSGTQKVLWTLVNL